MPPSPPDNPAAAVAALAQNDGRYHPDAFFWLLNSLNHLLEKVVDEEKGLRHVGGEELALFLVTQATIDFGPLACEVLHTWGIRKTLDFGEIVYALIGAGLLSKTSHDRLSDFDGVCDLDEALTAPFRPRNGGAWPSPGEEPLPEDDD
jgi:uncharacterized repeat protein (TIGR04138 family)